MEKQLIMNNDIAELSKLPAFVDEICDTLGLGPDKVFNLNLVLEEALTNVVLYAYPEGETHSIEVLAHADTEALVFTIEDSGVAFDPTKVPDADTTLSAEERPIGGLGIFLIRQLMSKVEYERVDNKNRLTMTLALA